MHLKQAHITKFNSSRYDNLSTTEYYTLIKILNKLTDHELVISRPIHITDYEDTVRILEGEVVNDK